MRVSYINDIESESSWFMRSIRGLVRACFFVVILSPSQAAFAELVIRFSTPNTSEKDIRTFYFYNVLRLALSKTIEKDGPYKLERIESSVLQSEAVQSLGKDNPDIDVLWVMTSGEREKKLNPIRIPLLKGLLGYRMLLINEHDQDKFNEITMTELKRLTAVQGASWPDTEILSFNGFTVKRAVFYLKMFERLAAGKADYFPRGVTEIWHEVRVHKKKRLIAEPTVMLYYRSPVYFFTNKSNTRLAERIERGLKLAVADGSFDDLFMGYADNKRAMEQIKKAKRIYKLNNPSLSPLTPIEDKALWFTP
jgi:hypothetical protein